MQEIKKVKIKELKLNDTNPRYIKEEKFEKLVNSIKNFPEMLEIRPIVVDENMTVLGGNMRLQASKKAGLTEIPIIIAFDLTEEQKREFVIKDNTNSGDWDWDVLANEWNTEELSDWGLTQVEFLQQMEDELLEEDEEEKEEPKPSASHDDYSIFELVMLHDNKVKFTDLINKIKSKYSIQKTEDALMHIVNTYKS